MSSQAEDYSASGRNIPFEKLMAPIPLSRPVLARQPVLTSVPGYCQNAIEPKGDCISCLGCNAITARATAKAPCVAVWNVPEAFSSCYLKRQFLISPGGGFLDMSHQWGGLQHMSLLSPATGHGGEISVHHTAQNS